MCALTAARYYTLEKRIKLKGSNALKIQKADLTKSLGPLISHVWVFATLEQKVAE